ncbi:hypothetical protein LQW54_012451 [Pestalotiopsis sp. IQ-011]
MSRAGKLAPEVNRALFVKHLSYTVTPEDLFELFGKFGPIRQVRQGIAANTKGTAFVVYEDVMDAKQACDKLNGFNFQSRYLVGALQTTTARRTSADPSISSTSTYASRKASSKPRPLSTPIPVKRKEVKLAVATKVMTATGATPRKGKPDEVAEQARRTVLSFVRGFLPQKTSSKMVMT